jgi:hypothetical protein
MKLLHLKTVLGKWVYHPITILSYAINDEHGCMVVGKNGAIYHSGNSISELAEEYQGMGIVKISRKELINMGDVLIVFPFTSKSFTMKSDGSFHKTADSYVTSFNLLKIRQMEDFLKIIIKKNLKI